jgi:hypothetical protein
VHPVEISGRDGVVVIQVAPSRSAPHRNTANLECHVRRGEHTQRMTMREIQDLTLRVESRLALLERQFAQSDERFSNMCLRDPSIGIGVRAMAVPLAPLSLQLPNDRSIRPTFRQFTATRGTNRVRATIPHAPDNFRPILRGLRGRDTYDGADVIAEVRDTGQLEIFFTRKRDTRLVLYAGWLVGMAANALSIIDYLRIAAGSPGAEYGLELAVYNPSGFQVGEYGGREYGSHDWSGSPTFPRYAIGDRSDFADLVEVIERDFWNAIGIIDMPPLRVEF